MGLKAITFATKIMDAGEFEPGMDFESEENKSKLESDLAYMATLGLSDPLREGVAASIEQLNDACTNVRIVSGDHRLAVIQAGIALGMKEDPKDEDNCMDGEVLLDLLK